MSPAELPGPSLRVSQTHAWPCRRGPSSRLVSLPQTFRQVLSADRHSHRPSQRSENVVILQAARAPCLSFPYENCVTMPTLREAEGCVGACVCCARTGPGTWQWSISRFDWTHKAAGPRSRQRQSTLCLRVALKCRAADRWGLCCLRDLAQSLGLWASSPAEPTCPPPGPELSLSSASADAAPLQPRPLLPLPLTWHFLSRVSGTLRTRKYRVGASDVCFLRPCFHLITSYSVG